MWESAPGQSEVLSEGRINDAAYAGRPSVCRNCGALVGAGEGICAVCGAPVVGRADAGAGTANTDARSAVVRDPETLRFVRAIISRPATFTFVILFANVFIFLLITMAGGSENNEVLRAYGAKYNSLINEGEWWRFVTPVFIHIGVIHILVNMYSLFMLGPYVEKLYGSAKFIFFWVLTGIAGVAASYFASMYDMNEGFLGRFLFRGGDGPSAGASGALFGLVGVLFVFGIKFRRELPEEFKRAFGVGMLPTILINLFIGYTIPFIDNAAHLGGFLAGVVLALFVHYKRPGQRAGVAVAWHVLQVALLALVVVSFAMVWRNFAGPAPNLNGTKENLLTGGKSNAADYIDAINTGLATLAVTLGGHHEAAQPVIEKLAKMPSLNKNADALSAELRILLTRARDLMASKPQGRAAEREREQLLKKLVADIDDWEKRFDQWVKAEGKQFGFVHREPSPAPTPNGETQSPDNK
ncbi:MAG TPA: rhomboid family intramembrane serine protease [Pyrinomonadaceae bacterium]|jgi:membrane associated rhomboid family serine protease